MENQRAESLRRHYAAVSEVQLTFPVRVSELASDNGVGSGGSPPVRISEFTSVIVAACGGTTPPLTSNGRIISAPTAQSLRPLATLLP